MDTLAPEINFNNKIRYKNYIGGESKRLRNNRYVENKNSLNWEEFRKARNKYCSQLRKDKIEYERKFMKDIEDKDTGKELWRIIYQKAGWIKSLSPQLIKENGI